VGFIPHRWRGYFIRADNTPGYASHSHPLKGVKMPHELDNHVHVARGHSILSKYPYLSIGKKEIENMKKLVVLTGAGMSAESGIKTFRESGGLWEEYDVSEVATPSAWERNMDLVLRFYNERRRKLAACVPNEGHLGLARLEKHFDVEIITQNIDDLHERAGSSKVLHLHGELTKARSTDDPFLLYNIGYGDIKAGDTCEMGSQLRPHVVWFGEPVPMMDEAVKLTSGADIFVVIGSSLNVYPAAGLIQYAPSKAPLWLIDPNIVDIRINRRIEVIQAPASQGVAVLTERLFG
jgi:NAD-dependent deacetylase